jgi:hypothetical protein
MVPILLNLDFLLESRHMGSDRDCSRQPTGSYFGPEVRLEEIASDLLEPWTLSVEGFSVDSLLASPSTVLGRARFSTDYICVQA